MWNRFCCRRCLFLQVQVGGFVHKLPESEQVFLAPAAAQRDRNPAERESSTRFWVFIFILLRPIYIVCTVRNIIMVRIYLWEILTNNVNKSASCLTFTRQWWSSTTFSYSLTKLVWTSDIYSHFYSLLFPYFNNAIDLLCTLSNFFHESYSWVMTKGIRLSNRMQNHSPNL